MAVQHYGETPPLHHVAGHMSGSRFFMSGVWQYFYGIALFILHLFMNLKRLILAGISLKVNIREIVVLNIVERRWLAVFMIMASMLVMAPVAAESIQTILTVSGAISAKSGSGVAEWSLDALEKLGAQKITTRTPWHAQPVTYEGPAMSVLLDAVGAQGASAEVTALNDYIATIPLDDFRKHKVILATRADGQVLSRRDKGPLFIIYPFDDVPELKSDVYYSRSVWQVVRIKIK